MLSVLIWIVIVVGIIWLAIVARWFRWVLAAFAALVLVVILYFLHSDSERKKAEEASKHRVPIQQVEFEDLVLWGFQSSSQITGRVRNKSPEYSVIGAELEVYIQDCVVNSCETVGQTKVTSWSMNVPPMQTREYREYVYFPSLPSARGDYHWSYRVNYVKAR